MSRTTRRRAVRAVAPVAGLLAAGLLVWQGSYAAFSATTNSPTNSWATGSVVLKNNTFGAGNYQITGTAAFNATNMVPSSTAVTSKCITVESSGSLAGAVKLYTKNVTPSAAGTNQVSGNILVTVTELTTGVTASNIAADCSTFVGGTALVSGVALSALPTTYLTGLGSWSPSGAATQYAAYKISYTFNPGTSVTDVQGKTATADFVWEIDTP